MYSIYEVNKASVEVDELIDGQYQLLAANERGDYPIAPMGVELGLWRRISEYRITLAAVVGFAR